MKRLKEAGLTQKQLSEFVGVERETINAWLSGRTTPRTEPIKIFKFALALGYSHEETVAFFHPNEETDPLALRQDLSRLQQSKRQATPKT
ncbi:MAG: helix-turn-helix transcriptional regulator [Oscillatoria sp. SIO1A7]|nr:helix-turn-helix transcriptional regulator [Oscillatoria sp. SIO1A7]